MIKIVIGEDPCDIKMFVDRVQVPVPQMLLSRISLTIEAPDKRRLVLESEDCEIEASIDGEIVAAGAPLTRAADAALIKEWVDGKLSMPEPHTRRDAEDDGA